MFWLPGLDPAVLSVIVRPARAQDDDSVDFATMAARVTVLKADATEQLLLSDGPHSLQLDVRSGSVLDGPVRLSYPFGNPRHLTRRLQSVQRLATLVSTGRLPAGPRPSRERAGRWRRAIHALDLQRNGLSQREMAEVLFGVQDTRQDWRRFSDYLRGRMRRLVQLGDRMSASGYRQILST